jgi:hypothetical protein
LYQSIFIEVINMSNNTTQQAEKHADTSANKLTYSKPKLNEYGKIKNLTQGGGATTVDANGAMSARSMAMSDPKLKNNIRLMGRHPLGIGLYLFEYKPEFRDLYGHGMHFGVMANEVEQVLPGAVVVQDNGYKSVNYDAIGIHLSHWTQRLLN